jgi:hypothetical protein
MKKILGMVLVTMCLTSCAHAGTLVFGFTPPGFDNGAVCPASADTIQASNPVDALISWTGPQSGSDSLLTIPRGVRQPYSKNGMKPGAYSVHVMLRDFGGFSCDATTVIIVKGPPSKAVFN